ncbi:hypothetical protein KY317_00845 [Candidatus Woesearchaeota archaeon]|nr:hypothetical protein [Candidatus Woesearchaeota archaeon]
MPMILPRPYLFEIGTPLIVFNRRLIQPKSETDANDNYFEFNRIRFALDEIISPKELEELYFRNNKEAIEGKQADYVRRVLNKEFKSREAIKKTIKDNKVLGLIIEKILPVLTEEQLSRQIGDFLQEDEKQKQQEGQEEQQSAQQIQVVQEISPELKKELDWVKRDLKSRVNEEYRQYAARNPRTNDSSNVVDDRIAAMLTPSRRKKQLFTLVNEDSILCSQLLDRNIMLIENKVYDFVTAPEFLSFFQEHIDRSFYSHLQRFSSKREPRDIAELIEENKGRFNHKYHSRMVNKLMSSRMKINSEFYLPLFFQKDGDLLKRYLLLIERKIKLDSIEHYAYQEEELQKLSQEKYRLENLAQKNSYEQNNAGFEKRERGYYVYIKTPPYALKSPHIRGSDKYLEFPAAKIAVHVSYNSSYRKFQISDPVVINGYRHPFVSSGGAYASICLGRWASSLGQTKALPPEQAVLALLSQGKKTLMMGYRTGSNPHHKLTRTEWYDKTWLTKKQVEEKGLVVLNDFERRR